MGMDGRCLDILNASVLHSCRLRKYPRIMRSDGAWVMGALRFGISCAGSFSVCRFFRSVRDGLGDACSVSRVVRRSSLLDHQNEMGAMIRLSRTARTIFEKKTAGVGPDDRATHRFEKVRPEWDRERHTHSPWNVRLSA